MKFLLVTFLALLGCAAAENVSKRRELVGKIVKMLNGMKETITADGEKEQLVYDRYACWCEKTSKSKAEAIEKAQEGLRSNGQLIVKLTGLVATLTAEMKELKEKIKDNEGMKAGATGIRQKENSEFQEEAAETKNTLQGLEHALNLIMGSGHHKPSLLQSSTMQGRKAVVKVLEKLPSTIPNLPASHVAFLSEFVQGSSKSSPAAAQGILNEMYTTFSENLENAIVEEASQNRKFESLVAMTDKDTKTLTETRNDHAKEKAEAEAKLADTTKAYDDTEKQLQSEIEFFDQVKSACETKHEEWTARKSARSQELEGISKALEILTSDSVREIFNDKSPEEPAETPEEPAETPEEPAATPEAPAAAPEEPAATPEAPAAALEEPVATPEAPAAALEEPAAAPEEPAAPEELAASFLQIKRTPSLLQESTGAAVASAYNVLKTQVRKSHSLRLAALAAEVRTATAGHFDEVIGAIEKMMQTLRDEGTADQEKKDQCLKEYAGIARKTEHLDWLIENNQAKIDTLQNLVDLRTGQREETIGRITETKKELKQMTKERTDENEAFIQAKKDNANTVQLLEAAKGALAKFYETNGIKMSSQASMIQVKVSGNQVPDATLSESDSHKAQANGILALFDNLIGDLNRELSELKANEADATEKYLTAKASAEKMVKDLNEKKVTLEGIIGTRIESKTTEGADMKSSEGERDSELEWKAKIKPDCDWIINNLEDRAIARTAETEGLLSAKLALQGAKGQTALIAKEQKVSDDKLSSISFLGIK